MTNEELIEKTKKALEVCSHYDRVRILELVCGIVNLHEYPDDNYMKGGTSGVCDNVPEHSQRRLNGGMEVFQYKDGHLETRFH